MEDDKETVNGHVFTYETEEMENVARITSYDSDVQFYSTDVEHIMADGGENSDLESYPLAQETVEEVAAGIRGDEVPLTGEQIVKKLGGMTSSEKARAKMDFFY